MNIINNIKKAEWVTRVIVLSIILLSNITQAATISVDSTDGGIADDGVCSISEAIIAANTDIASGVSVGECPAGSLGVDTIELLTDVTFISEYADNTTYGKTATPDITSIIIIDGMGYTLQRSDSLNCDINGTSELGEFRLLFIAGNGNLELKNISLKNGCADGSQDQAIGGGVKSEGLLKIKNSYFANNKASSSGAIDNAGVISEINNSLFSDNSALNDGGGITNNSSITMINATTFLGNSAGFEGGGIYNIGQTTEIRNSTFSENSASIGGGINNRGTITEINNNTVANNKASSTAGGIKNQGLIISMSNNLFNNNIAPTYADCNNIPGNVSGNNNLSNQNSNNCTNADITSGLTASSVSPLADNGCVTALADGSCIMTHALLVGSEAIDSALSGTTTDQRDFSVVDGNRDIGAFEFLTPQEQCSQNGIDTTVVFSVNVNSVHGLNTAIFCANVNAATIDTISLATDITFKSSYQDDTTYGKTATPDIRSAIIIEGMGFALQRDISLICNSNNVSDPAEFRLFFIAIAGDLNLNNAIIKNGCSDGAEPLSDGGGIFTQGVLKINNSQFINNTAYSGGGIYNKSTITEINNSSFRGNSSQYGGGIASLDGDITIISQSTFSGNQAVIDGGGVYADNGGTISEIVNSTFSGNSALNGAGLYNNNNTISFLKNSTFANNNASNTGGGIYNSGTVISISNNLFNNNAASTSMDCYMVAGSVSGNNNLSNQDSNNCTSAGISDGLTTSTVGSLADNGCTTPLADGICVMTHELLAGSEAIDMGNINATDFDQRNYSRNGVRDIGAFEYGSPSVDMIFINGFD